MALTLYQCEATQQRRFGSLVYMAFRRGLHTMDAFPAYAEHCYTAYGLTLASEIACPELPVGAGQPEVRIHYRPVPAHLDQPKATGVLFEAAAGCFLLCVEGVGRFLVREGCEIAIDRAPHATDGEVRLLLLGYAFGALLHQR